MIDEALRARVELMTGHPCFLMEVEESSEKPYYLIENLPDNPYYGSMGGSAEHGDMNYQFSIIGISKAHCDAAETKLFETLRDDWQLAHVMGPPELRRNGGSRQDDRTYRTMLIATYTVEMS